MKIGSIAQALNPGEQLTSHPPFGGEWQLRANNLRKSHRKVC
jgi:hypothetical protein